MGTRRSSLKRTLKGYVDKVSNFKGRKWGGDIVDMSHIKCRALDIDIPKGMSSAQQQVFNDMIDYAKRNSVQLTVHTM